LLAALNVSDENDRDACLRRNLAMWRLSARRGSEGDFWPQFFADCPPAARFPAAIAAALGGHDLPDVRDILQDVFTRRVSKPALGRKAPPPCLAALLALAELPTTPVTANLCALLDTWFHPLTGDAASLVPGTRTPAKILAILKTLASADDRDAAIKSIRAFLAKWPEEPFATHLAGVLWWQQPWDLFRFAIELRAARTLIKLGDKDVLPLLKPYLKDDSLLVRRYARKILAERDGAVCTP
jgi:HEAT repeat protein